MPVLYLIIAFFFIIRTLFWLSIWQQKEYRLDRLRAFLQTPDGRQQALTFLHFPRSLKELRRPHPTLKILIITIFTALLVVLSNPFSLLNLIVIYTAIPLYLIIGSFPAWLLTWATKQWFIYQTKKLLHRHKPIIIGITGSYGKSSTKHLANFLIQTQKKVWTSPKSFNTPLSLTQSFTRTYQGEPILLIECGAYKRGEIASLTSIFPPQIAILTGIAPQHLATFGTFPDLIRAKSELPQALSSGQDFIINDSNSDVVNIAANFSHLTIHKASSQPVLLDKLNQDGTLELKFRRLHQSTHLIGLHYLEIIKLALTLLDVLNLDSSKAFSQLHKFKPQSNYITRLKLSNRRLLIDDGVTTNPQGFKAGIELLKALPHSHKLIISPGIIDLAQESDQVHRQLAQLMLPHIDCFIHTSPTAHKILKHNLKHKYIAISNPNTLTQFINSKFQQDSAILIEGKLNPDMIKNLRTL